MSLAKDAAGSTIDCITFDCADPQHLASFWAAALNYTLHEDKGGWVALRPIQGKGALLGFQQVPESKIVKNRVHLDLRVPQGVALDAEVTRLEGLGARRVRLVDDDPSEPHMIMQDPEDNEFCVL